MYSMSANCLRKHGMYLHVYICLTLVSVALLCILKLRTCIYNVDHFQDEFITPLLVCCVVGSSTYDAAKLLVQSNARVNGVEKVST